MVITKTDIIGLIRKAIDDIVPSGTTDSFVSDANDELWQATIHAATELSLELPIDLLDVTVDSPTGAVDLTRGFAHAELPDDYLRFVSIDVAGWKGVVRELIEQGSDAEKMQRSPWSRGTASKPKAMLNTDETGKKVIVWWPGSDSFKNAQVAYISVPDVVTTATETIPVVPAIDCAIREAAKQQVVYRAAAIYFEGKKEGAIADRFRNL
jgi:hypothetical protein